MTPYHLKRCADTLPLTSTHTPQSLGFLLGSEIVRHGTRWLRTHILHLQTSQRERSARKRSLHSCAAGLERLLRHDTCPGPASPSHASRGDPGRSAPRGQRRPTGRSASSRAPGEGGPEEDPREPVREGRSRELRGSERQACLGGWLQMVERRTCRPREDRMLYVAGPGENLQRFALRWAGER